MGVMTSIVFMVTVTLSHFGEKGAITNNYYLFAKVYFQPFLYCMRDAFNDISLFFQFAFQGCNFMLLRFLNAKAASNISP